MSEAAPAEAYCEACQALVRLKEAVKKKTNIGKVYWEGKCAVCGLTLVAIPPLAPAQP